MCSLLYLLCIVLRESAGTSDLKISKHIGQMLACFGLWEGAGVSKENPHRHREIRQTPHRQDISPTRIGIRGKEVNVFINFWWDKDRGRFQKLTKSLSVSASLTATYDSWKIQFSFDRHVLAWITFYTRWHEKRDQDWLNWANHCTQVFNMFFRLLLFNCGMLL